jgi:hypothetical protein
MNNIKKELLLQRNWREVEYHLEELDDVISALRTMHELGDDPCCCAIPRKFLAICGKCVAIVVAQAKQNIIMRG